MVTWENYEEYLVMQADGELDAAGQQELEAFMQLHPEVREELALFETVRLVPDETQVFEHKQTLLKEEPKGMVISFGQWFRYGAAAGLLLLVALGIMKWQGRENGTPIANTDSAINNVSPIATNDDTVTAQQEEILVKEEEEPMQAVKQERIVKPKVTFPKPQQKEVAIVKEEIKKEQSLPERIEIARMDRLAVDKSSVTQPQAVNLPALQMPKEQTAPEPYQPELLAWLPVDEERKQGLGVIGDAISERVERVKTITNSIKNTDVAVRLGNKELFTVRF